MDVLWRAQGPLKVREVLERLDTGRVLAYTTVMTVLDNLHRKDWVTRERDGKRRGSVVDPAVLIDDPRSGSAVVPGLSGSPTACFAMPASGSGTGAVVKSQGTVWRRAFFEAGAVQCGDLVDDCPCELNRG